MRDGGGRNRGYGYADFEDREALCEVLAMTDLAVNNRNNILSSLLRILSREMVFYLMWEYNVLF